MNTGKVTVSLPKEDLRKIAECEKQLKISRSGLFKEAVELWLRVVETRKRELQYKKVFSERSVSVNDKQITEELLPLALEIWPKY